jgi:HEAT repeat protein
MNCERTKNQFADYLAKNLDEPTLAEVRGHLSGCESCQSELTAFESTWARLGVLSDQQPSPRLRARFYAALEAYQQELRISPPRASVTLAGWFESWRPNRPVFQIAAASLLLVVGFGLGRWNPQPEKAREELAQLRGELKETRELVTLSLLQQQSASERLKGVNWSYQISQPDERIVTALVGTLNFDPNVNVRLAAVDALQQLAGHPGVRASLVQALPRQESPIVQVALIDLLVGLKEKQSVEVLRKLLQDTGLHKSVRARAESGLKQMS